MVMIEQHCQLIEINQRFSMLSIELNRIEKIYRAIFTSLGNNGDFRCQIVGQFSDTYRRGS